MSEFHQSDKVVTATDNLINRRQLLRYLLGGAMVAALPGVALAENARQSLPPGVDVLDKAIRDAIGNQVMGVDVRKLDDKMQVVFELAYNADQLYPVASCFKAFLVYFYFWNMPPEQWKTDRDSDAYRVAVFSDNVRSGFLMRDAAAYVDVYGNIIEKFNDCLLYNLGMTQGMHTWKWEGNPLIGITDRRFAPSDTRYINLRGTAHIADNLTTAADLATGYTFLAQAAAGTLAPKPMNPLFDMARAQRAAQAAIDLLSIPAENYKSPIERAGLAGYTGKDGILPKDDLTVGNVVSDAGIVTVGESRYVLSFISVSQSEFAAVNTLTAIANALKTFEGVPI